MSKPCAAAKCSAIYPSLSAASTSAGAMQTLPGCPTSMTAHDKWPPFTAMWRGVSCRLSRATRSAPRLSSALTIGSWPTWQAKCRAVMLKLCAAAPVSTAVRTSTSHTGSRSSKHASLAVLTATCRALLVSKRKLGVRQELPRALHLPVHHRLHQRRDALPVIGVCVRPGVEEELHTRHLAHLGGPSQGGGSVIVRQVLVRAAL